jgi:crotonobetainyl-CoA:carnitine CoA-transferase CaiB-like acyl-CoA transferase
VPSIIAHMVFNAVPVFGVMFGWITIEQDPGPFPVGIAIGGVCVTLVLVLAMLYLAWRSGRTGRARQEDLT